MHPTTRLSVTCAAPSYDVRVCVNKTCRRQGSIQIGQLAKDLALPGIDAETSGCLGSCGAGPNMAVIPVSSDGIEGRPLLLHHVSTPAKLAEILSTVCNATVDEKLLKATELRLAGNSAVQGGDTKSAIKLYTQALELDPSVGAHMLLSNRSAARLASGDAAGAADDAAASSACCPDEFTNAAVRLADALFALGRYQESLEALDAGAKRHPPWGKSKEFCEIRQQVAKSVFVKAEFL